MSTQNTRMIDVSSKRETHRLATARARIDINRATMAMVRKNKLPKGDVLAVAQAAGILAAKRTPDLIPLCHPLLLTSISIDFNLPARGSHIDIAATVKGRGQTGFEMEALTAAAVAALTIYDMCKMFDPGMVISGLRLVKKSGGKSGDYSAD
jgi:cyclic pyranopterin monophosphate synthase